MTANEDGSLQKPTLGQYALIKERVWMKILWNQARKLGRCDSFLQNLTADSISVLVFVLFLLSLTNQKQI